MRRLLAPLLLAVLGTLAGVAMLELLLRAAGFYAPAWYGPDRELGWSLRPHLSGRYLGEGHAWVEINSAGQRDREHALAKPPGAYRIAVLGDSYAEAMQVDVNDTFWRVLEHKLDECRFRPGKSIEVINFGVSGYGTVHEYLLLQSTAARYAPDLVLLAFTNGNDLRNNSMELEPEKGGPFFRPGPAGLALDSSFRDTEAFRRRSSALLEFERTLSDHVRVLQAAHFAHKALRERRVAAAMAQAAEPGIDYAAFAPPRTRAWEEAWLVTQELIARMGAFAAARGIALAIVPVTAAVQVDPQPRVRDDVQKALGVGDLFYIEHRLARIGESNGARVIPLAYEMQRQAQDRGVYFHGFDNVGMGKGHWNENGHRAAAAIIARELCASPP
jgi:hypothetical protein